MTAVGDPGPAAPGRPGGLALLVVVSYGSAALVEANLGAMTLPGGVEVVVA